MFTLAALVDIVREHLCFDFPEVLADGSPQEVGRLRQVVPGDETRDVVVALIDGDGQNLRQPIGEQRAVGIWEVVRDLIKFLFDAL